MGKRNKVTTRDIAKATNVSQATVSMILSDKTHLIKQDIDIINVK